MKGRSVKLLSLALLLCLLVCGVPAFAEEAEPAYTDMRIYIDGLLTCRGYARGGTSLLPVEDVCRFFNVELTINRDDKIGRAHV